MSIFNMFRQKKYDDNGDGFISKRLSFRKIDETLTPNMRALRLTMTACDVLLSMGVSANSVVTKGLDITETFCARPVHIDISSNQMFLSQLRGVDKEPLTLMRPVAHRRTNNRTIQAIQKLIYDITQQTYTLEEAEAKLDKILSSPKAHPWWVVMMGRAGVVAGVSMIFTSSWQITVTAYVIGLMTDRILEHLDKRALPSFFQQILAATFVTLSAAVVAMLARQGVSFFEGINPTLIVVSGIVMLVAGLAIVAAVQDAIEEFYISANARLLRTGMLTIGIAIGVVIGLYIARQLGIGITVSPDPLTPNTLDYRMIGAGIASASFALATHTHWLAIIWAGMVGASAVAIAYITQHFGIASIPASGVSAVIVGLIASLLSRVWRTPSIGTITAGIIPLVPGLALYSGLMQLINYPPGDPLFIRGLGTLFLALTTALAVATGASFGSMIGRPLRQKITHNRNMAPFIQFMRRQLTPRRKRGLANAALGKHRPDD